MSPIDILLLHNNKNNNKNKKKCINKKHHFIYTIKHCQKIMKLNILKDQTLLKAT